MRQTQKHIGVILSALASVQSATVKAGAASDYITATMALETATTTAVPLLGTPGAIALAVLVALVLHRGLVKHPRNINTLLVAGIAGTAVGSAIWVSEATSGSAFDIVPLSSDADCASFVHQYGDGVLVTLQNDCGGPVKVTYSLAQGTCKSIEELICPAAGEYECVPDGGSAPSGGGLPNTLYGCFPRS